MGQCGSQMGFRTAAADFVDRRNPQLSAWLEDEYQDEAAKLLLTKHPNEQHEVDLGMRCFVDDVTRTSCYVKKTDARSLAKAANRKNNDLQRYLNKSGHMLNKYKTMTTIGLRGEGTVTKPGPSCRAAASCMALLRKLAAF